MSATKDKVAEHERIALRLADIQGNILNAYGKQGFPKGRVILLHVDDGEKGREFLENFYDKVTTAVRWKSDNPYAPKTEVEPPERPPVTLNFAFTFNGLVALGVPIKTLSMMPAEFLQGMRARAPILGDTSPDGALDRWDEVWKSEAQAGSPKAVHIMALLNSKMNPTTGNPVPEMDALTEEIRSECNRLGGVRILTGHGAGAEDFQDMSARLMQDPETGQYKPVPLEHFGYVDGISDPVFEGQFRPEDENVRKVGNGKFTGKLDTPEAVNDENNWEPLATGEFLLGYPDEAKETPPAARPNLFSTNGTFMAYRKLEEKVEDFEDYIDETVPQFAKVYGIEDHDEARATLFAKFSGRWQDGVPLMLAPTYKDWIAFNERYQDSVTKRAMLSRFVYINDEHGAACPASSHTRRVHPRDMLGPKDDSGTILVNRRRILRRGLPYDTTNEAGERERGIVMLICCSSLERQFEFVQQQWINYGMDSNAGNDTCPLLGNRSTDDLKFVIPNDPEVEEEGAPYICSKMPQFVEAKGGAYFFIPSMTSLRLIAIGMIDPT
jgi:Dyp-type peroxidase family